MTQKISSGARPISLAVQRVFDYCYTSLTQTTDTPIGARTPAPGGDGVADAGTGRPRPARCGRLVARGRDAKP